MLKLPRFYAYPKNNTVIKQIFSSIVRESVTNAFRCHKENRRDTGETSTDETTSMMYIIMEIKAK